MNKVSQINLSIDVNTIAVGRSVVHAQWVEFKFKRIIVCTSYGKTYNLSHIDSFLTNANLEILKHKP